MEKYPTGRVEETATIYLDDEHGPVSEQVVDATEDSLNEFSQVVDRVIE